MKGGRGREEQVIAEARFCIVMVWWQAMVLYLVKQTNKQQGDWGDYCKAAQYIQVIQEKAAR
jgi:hypothetical protein